MFAENDSRVQGLISIKIRKDVYAIEVNVVESSPFNNPHNPHFKRKEYIGVGGHLFALAVKLSFENGFDGFVVFKAKTNLISHYENTLGASLYNRKERMMFINERSARKLYDQYFKE